MINLMFSDEELFHEEIEFHKSLDTRTEIRYEFLEDIYDPYDEVGNDYFRIIDGSFGAGEP